MSKDELPIYRLPIATANRVGQARVVTDRHGTHYINGSRLASATPSGDFVILETERGETLYVRASDFAQLSKPRKR